MSKETAVFLAFLTCLACSGCATNDAMTAPMIPAPPGAEHCPATFDHCVELCRPLGVRHFGCWSGKSDVEFDCECLEGSKPLEDDSPRQSLLLPAYNVDPPPLDARGCSLGMDTNPPTAP
jgi:hypothetical protein